MEELMSLRKTLFSILAAVVIGVAAPVAATAETIDVFDNHGGSVAEYSARWAGLAAKGVNVRIVGPCQSACTVLLKYIPNSRICVMPQASFGFHQAHLPQMTAVLWSGYSSGIRSWINARGGL